MGSTGFRIDSDGTIIREPGNVREPNNDGKKNNWLWMVLVFIGAAIGLYFLIDSESGGSNSYLSPEERERNEVINTINRYNEAYTSNDFVSLGRIFAEDLTRFQSVYNWTNDQVVADCKQYDKRYGVYSKHSSVRWNTLQINRLSDTELSVVYVEDYSMDRKDKSKYSYYVLEKHIILDQDYRIKSIYDVQLERRRQ